MKEEDKNEKEQKSVPGGQQPDDAEDQGTWWEELIRIFRDVIDLRQGLDRYGTILSIRNNIHLKGINVWMLICAIVVASIGLDKSSPAVIIGGMLISPLMYPILGLGLSIAINDRQTLLRSAENFGVAVAITLVTSTIYFLLTPYGKPNAEILSRTTPDIMDVFVGFFGGIAGIVAGSRKAGASSAIPGVAIATALLPPVCVAGYGLANWDMAIFGGAFYLFILNTFFIMIATYLVVRFLKFPYKQHTTEAQNRQARMAIGAAAFLIILPSFFFLRNSVNDIRLNNHVENFVIDHLENERIRDFGWSLKDRDSVQVLEVDCYVEDLLSEAEVDSLQQMLVEEYRAKNVRLVLNQIEASSDDIRNLQVNQSALRTEIEKTRQSYTMLVKEMDDRMEEMQDKLQLETADSTVFEAMKDELRIWFPDLKELTAGKVWYTDYHTERRQFLVILDWERRLSQNIYDQRTGQVTSYMMKRYPVMDTVYVIHR